MEDSSPTSTLGVAKEQSECSRAMTDEKRSRIWQVVGKKISQLAKERKLLFAKNAEYCRLCILDAFQGRLSNGLANNSKKSWWIYTIFCIQTSTLLFRCVMGACIFHTISIFAEPENACSNSSLYTFLQILVLLIYSFDIALKMSYEGIEEYFSHDWQQLYVIVVILCGVDLMFNKCTLYTNPLRPVVGVLRARKGRRFFEVLKKMMPGMTHSLVPLLFFIVIVMVASALIFDNTIQELASPIFTSYNWFFLIFTNDNFDRILPDAVLHNISYLVFFFPCIYVGQQFLLSLIIGDTYETYKAFVKKQLKKERLKEMQGLTKAFSALDHDKTGTITAIQWKVCCNKYDPTIPDEAVALYFELLSGGNNAITVLQFLSIRSVLDFNLTLRSNKKAIFSSLYLPVKQVISSLYTKIQLPIPESLVTFGKNVLAVEGKWELLLKLNAVDLIALCLSLSDFMIGPLKLPVVGEVSVSFGILINSAYLMEFVARLCANEGKIHAVHAKNNITAYVFVLGVAGRITTSLVQGLYGLSDSVELSIPFLVACGVTTVNSIPLKKINMLFRALRCTRVINLNKDLRNFSMALLDVLPALIETFTFSFIVTYIFGTLGNLLFGLYMEEWRTPLRSVVKAQQLTFMVDFLGSTEAAMDAVHPAASAFFVFYLILTLAVSNIALSIIIELQNSMLAGKTTKDRDSQKAKLDIMFNKIKDQARIRAVFSARGKMNFNNIVMSQFQSSDTRHFIADMDGEKHLKLEDIKSCQKYSSIDLVGHYIQEHRNNSDQHWEVDFLTAMNDSGIKTQISYKPGQYIISAGEPADRLFLVISGSVAVSDPKCLGHTFATATYFIGQEALAPRAQYQYQCVADSDCVLLAISHSDITDHLDADHCGIILRMGMKSFAKLEAGLQDARKKASRVASQTFSSNEASPTDDSSTRNQQMKHLQGIAPERGIHRDNSFNFGICETPREDRPVSPTPTVHTPTAAGKPPRNSSLSRPSSRPSELNKETS